MRTLNIVPVGINVTVEMSVEELLLLKQGLESTELKLNLQNEKDADISDFMTKTLYEYVCTTLKEIGVVDD